VSSAAVVSDERDVAAALDHTLSPGGFRALQPDPKKTAALDAQAQATEAARIAADKATRESLMQGLQTTASMYRNAARGGVVSSTSPAKPHSAASLTGFRPHEPVPASPARPDASSSPQHPRSHHDLTNPLTAAIPGPSAHSLALEDSPIRADAHRRAHEGLISPGDQHLFVSPAARLPRGREDGYGGDDHADADDTLDAEATLDGEEMEMDFDDTIDTDPAMLTALRRPPRANTSPKAASKGKSTSEAPMTPPANLLPNKSVSFSPKSISDDGNIFSTHSAAGTDSDADSPFSASAVPRLPRATVVPDEPHEDEHGAGAYEDDDGHADAHMDDDATDNEEEDSIPTSMPTDPIHLPPQPQPQSQPQPPRQEVVSSREAHPPSPARTRPVPVPAPAPASPQPSAAADRHHGDHDDEEEEEEEGEAMSMSFSGDADADADAHDESYRDDAEPDAASEDDHEDDPDASFANDDDEPQNPSPSHDDDDDDGEVDQDGHRTPARSHSHKRRRDTIMRVGAAVRRQEEEEEQEHEGEGPSLRRSKRPRMPPIEYWKADVVYSRRNDDPLDELVPAIKGVVNFSAETPKKPPKKASKSSKKGKSSKSSEKATAEALEEHDALGERNYHLVSANSSKRGSKRENVVQRDVEHSLLMRDPDGRKKTRILIKARGNLLYEPLPQTMPQTSAVARPAPLVSPLFNVENVRTGVMMLPPGAVKAAITPGSWEMFYVDSCGYETLQVNIDGVNRCLSGGDSFRVPGGVAYSCANLSTEHFAKLVYFSLKEDE
jgi:hypothetical protein